MNMASKAGAPAPDWAAWEAKLTTPGAVEAVKAAYEKDLANPELKKKLDETLETTQASLKAAFHGPDGLIPKAVTEAKAADAGLLQCIAELELLEKQIGGVSEQTIAEILEMEPELRAEVEAELDA